MAYNCILPFEDPRLPHLWETFVQSNHKHTKFNKQHPKSLAMFNKALVIAKELINQQVCLHACSVPTLDTNTSMHRNKTLYGQNGRMHVGNVEMVGTLFAVICALLSFALLVSTSLKRM